MLPVESLVVERQGRTIHLKKTEHSDSLNIQFSIVNIQFRLVRVRVPKNDMEINIEKGQSAATPSFEILLFCGSLFSGFTGSAQLPAAGTAWVRLS
jgi:hypothetical protein